MGPMCRAPGEAQGLDMARCRTNSREVRRLGEIRRLFVYDLLFKITSSLPSPRETSRGRQAK